MDEQDIEFEITDLKRETSGDTSTRRSGGISGLVASYMRSPNRRRIANGALAVLAVALVATVVSQLAPYLGAAAERTATATATKSGPSARVFLLDGVPWGTMRIDGKKKFQDPSGSLATDGLLIPPGRHTIEYDAPPFPPLTCHFTVPVATSDDCASLTEQYPNLPGQVISLEAYPSRLPSGQQDALYAAITDALNSSAKPTKMVPGEHYSTQSGDVAVANEPITAQVIYAISAYGSVTDMPGIGAGTSTPDYAWHLLVPIQMRYRYTAPDGTLSASASFPPAPNHDTVPMNVRYDATWHAREQGTPGTTCEVAQNGPQNAVQILLSPGGNGHTTFSSALASNPSDGCLIRVSGDFGTQQQPVSGTALFLYRFGVTLAANDLAHRVVPSLPVIASQTETDLVRQLVSKLGPQG